MKQRLWEEKRDANRNKIEQQLENNRSKLSDAQEHLAKLEEVLERKQSQRKELQDKIYASNNDSWVGKANGWLEDHDNEIDKLEDKISNKEEYIGKLETWISNDEDKLNNWD